MDFEWDAKKDARNQKKHGISFPSAMGVFLDADRLEVAEEGGDETRWIVIGRVESQEITVVYTMRGESIRLISARKATRNERQDYWNR